MEEKLLPQNYIRIPQNFFLKGWATFLTPAQKDVYYYICSRLTYGKWVTHNGPTQEEISRKTKRCKTTVNRAVQLFMKKYGLIERGLGYDPLTGGRKAPVYFVKEIESLAPDFKDKEEGVKSTKSKLCLRGEKGKFQEAKSTGDAEAKSTGDAEAKSVPVGQIDYSIDESIDKKNTRVSNQKKDSPPAPLDGVKKSQKPKRKFQDRRSKPSLLGRSKAGESKLGTKPHKGMPSLAVESLRELLKSREPRWLRAHLVSRGYDPREADKAIREAQAPEAKRPRRR